MKKAVAVTLVILAAWSIIIALGHHRKPGTDYGPSDGSMTAEKPGDRAFKKAALREVEATLATWPQRPQRAAHAMIEKYGLPDESGKKRLVWNDNGPWKRTIVRRDAANEVLSQTAVYRVPNDRYELIGGLPGRVSAERGREELAASSDSESLNFLALNLADEVISGKRQLDDAHKAYDRAAALAASGKSSPYTQSLLFAEPPAAPAPAPAGKKR